MRRKSYQDEVKESSKGKSTAVSSAPKKQRTTGVPTPATTPMPTPLPTAHGGKAMEVDTRGGTSQPSSYSFSLAVYAQSEPISRNKEHLVQVLSEWIVASIEPAKELTRTKEPEFMFLHTKDFWFRSIWIGLHQALTIDRESSRDRAPIGLVRCICRDDYVKGKHAHVKFKLSNIHAFVPV